MNSVEDPVFAETCDLYQKVEALTLALAEARRLNAQLVEALTESIEAVKFFHGPEALEIYVEHSPEMKRWGAALKAARGEKP